MQYHQGIHWSHNLPIIHRRGWGRLAGVLLLVVVDKVSIVKQHMDTYCACVMQQELHEVHLLS